jgi:hypothetical protein
MSFPKRVIIPKSLPHGVHGGNFTLQHSTITLQYRSHAQIFFQNFILSIWGTVIILNPHTQTNAHNLHRITIIHTHELSYMFQQYITMLGEKSIQWNLKFIHPIYIHIVKNKY